MAASERKIVHLYTAGAGEGVTTESAGAEPNRYVVVGPASLRVDVADRPLERWLAALLATPQA